MIENNFDYTVFFLVWVQSPDIIGDQSTQFQIWLSSPTDHLKMGILLIVRDWSCLVSTVSGMVGLAHPSNRGRVHPFISFTDFEIVASWSFSMILSSRAYFNSNHKQHSVRKPITDALIWTGAFNGLSSAEFFFLLLTVIVMTPLQVDAVPHRQLFYFIMTDSHKIQISSYLIITITETREPSSNHYWKQHSSISSTMNLTPSALLFFTALASNSSNSCVVAVRIVLCWSFQIMILGSLLYW
jgi:hypothetical protein